MSTNNITQWSVWKSTAILIDTRKRPPFQLLQQKHGGQRKHACEVAATHATKHLWRLHKMIPRSTRTSVWLFNLTVFALSCEGCDKWSERPISSRTKTKAPLSPLTGFRCRNTNNRHHHNCDWLLSLDGFQAAVFKRAKAISAWGRRMDPCLFFFFFPQ